MSSSGFFPAVGALWQSKKEKYRQLHTASRRSDASNCLIGRGARHHETPTRIRERSPSISREEREARAHSIPRSGNKERNQDKRQHVPSKDVESQDQSQGRANADHASREQVNTSIGLEREAVADENGQYSAIESSVDVASKHSVDIQRQVGSNTEDGCDLNMQVDRRVTRSDKQGNITIQCTTPSKIPVARQANTPTGNTICDRVTASAPVQADDHKRQVAVKSWVQLHTRVKKETVVATSTNSERSSTRKVILCPDKTWKVQILNASHGTPVEDNSSTQSHVKDAASKTTPQAGTRNVCSEVGNEEHTAKSQSSQDQTNNASQETGQSSGCVDNNEVTGCKGRAPISRRPCVKVNKRIDGQVVGSVDQCKKIRTEHDYSRIPTPPSSKKNKINTFTPSGRRLSNASDTRVNSEINVQPQPQQSNKTASAALSQQNMHQLRSRVKVEPPIVPTVQAAGKVATVNTCITSVCQQERSDREGHPGVNMDTPHPKRQGKKPIIPSHNQRREMANWPYPIVQAKQSGNSSQTRQVEHSQISNPTRQESYQSRRQNSGPNAYYNDHHESIAVEQHTFDNTIVNSDRNVASTRACEHADVQDVIIEDMNSQPQPPSERVILKARRKCPQPPQASRTNDEVEMEVGEADDDEFSPLQSPHTLPPGLQAYIPEPREVFAKFSIPTEQIPCSSYMSGGGNDVGSISSGVNTMVGECVVTPVTASGVNQAYMPPSNSTTSTYTMTNSTAYHNLVNSKHPVSADCNDKAATVNVAKSKCTPEKSVCKVKPFMKGSDLRNANGIRRSTKPNVTSRSNAGAIDGQSSCSQPVLIRDDKYMIVGVPTRVPSGKDSTEQYYGTSEDGADTETLLADEACDDDHVGMINPATRVCDQAVLLGTPITCVVHKVQQGKQANGGGVRAPKPVTPAQSKDANTSNSCLPAELFVDRHCVDPLYWDQDIMKMRFTELVHFMHEDEEDPGKRNKDEVPAVNLLAEDCRLDTQQVKDEMNFLEKEYRFYGSEVRKSWDKFQQHRTSSEQAKNEQPRKQRRPMRNRRGVAVANENGGAGFLESQHDGVLRRGHRLGRAIRKLVREGELTEERIEEYTKACRALRDQADRQKVLIVEYMRCPVIAGQLPAVVAKYRGRSFPNENGLYLDYQGVPENASNSKMSCVNVSIHEKK